MWVIVDDVLINANMGMRFFFFKQQKYTKAKRAGTKKQWDQWRTLCFFIHPSILRSVLSSQRSPSAKADPSHFQAVGGVQPIAGVVFLYASFCPNMERNLENITVLNVSQCSKKHLKCKWRNWHSLTGAWTTFVEKKRKKKYTHPNGALPPSRVSPSLHNCFGQTVLFFIDLSLIHVFSELFFSMAFIISVNNLWIFPCIDCKCEWLFVCVCTVFG